jgi:hypothetical protein
MKACKQCGVPYPISRYHTWTNDGRLLTRDKNQRLVIVERELMSRIFESLGEELERQTYQILRETKAFDAKTYVQGLMGRKISIMRRFFTTRRMLVDQLVEFLKVLGMARLEVLEYQSDGTTRFRCYHCYQRDFLLGDLLGGYLVLEGKPFEAFIEEGDGYFDILIQPRPGLVDPTSEFSYEPEEPAIGYLGYKTCRKCGTPLPVSFFHWDLEEGTVRDTRSGENVVFIDTIGINMAVEKMKADYHEVDGEDLEHLLARNTKTVVDSLIPLMDWKHRRPEEQVRDLFFLAFRGMGNPIFTEPVEGGIKVRVENPYSYPMVAGIVASFVAKDRPSDFTWSRVAESRLEVIIRYR